MLSPWRRARQTLTCGTRIRIEITRFLTIHTPIPRWKRRTSVSQHLSPSFSTSFVSLQCDSGPGKLTQLTASYSLMQRRSHSLRYVMKNKDTGDVLFVVVFTLIPKEDVEREEAEAEAKKQNEEKAEKEEIVEGDQEGEGGFEPNEDDVD